MKLYYSPASPFARKCLILAMESGLESRIELAAANPWNDESLRALNPLCKVPTLIADDGTALYDLRVICAYLDRLGGGGLIAPGDTRALVLEALADGISDAAVRKVMEGRRPEGDRHADVIERQTKAIEAALDQAPRLLAPGAFGIGEIALACALGYLDFRLGAEHWREGRETLAGWCAQIEQRPSLAKTRPA